MDFAEALAEEAKMDCSYGKTGRPRCKMGLNGKALCVGLSALGSLFRALTSACGLGWYVARFQRFAEVAWIEGAPIYGDSSLRSE